MINRALYSFLTLLLLGFCSTILAQEVPIKSYTINAAGQAEIGIDTEADHYYLLYASETGDYQMPTRMVIGDGNPTIITEALAAYEEAAYSVIKVPLATPLDVDNDGINDLIEYEQANALSPFNPGYQVPYEDGVVHLGSEETFHDLSFRRRIDVFGDTLENLEVIKFYLVDDGLTTMLFFLNSNSHINHADFEAAASLPSPLNTTHFRGQIVFHPDIMAASGKNGTYRFRFQPNDRFPFERIQQVQELLAANMPFLENNFCYYPMPAALDVVEMEMSLYDNSRVCLLYESDLYADFDYLPFNLEEGYGILTILNPGEEPNPRDVVILEQLPNDLSRIAGIISTVPQTPLSHINLRAIQDKAPNAFVRSVLDSARIADLLDKFVYYKTEPSSFTLAESTREAVDAYFEDLRPKSTQFPLRDLSQQAILPLEEINFEDSDKFGVKCTNVAVMHQFNFEDGTIPDGYGVPFYFYDEFMKHNGFYDLITELFNDNQFNSDLDYQKEALKDFRDSIKDGDMPDWMLAELDEMHKSFPQGTSVRCRSSTNNEDLPGFSGAGLYDSKTQHPDEGHIAKSIKQVYASIWNFRAFEERSFYRIDHLQTAMGVLCHPNYSNEKANGVAVTTDPIYETDDSYYVNTQLGEDLVTNPNANSIPEELILPLDTSIANYILLRSSNQVNSGELLLSEAQINLLRDYMKVIHDEFELLYEADDHEDFAMEIEFKITEENQLSIKQARPWSDFRRGVSTEEHPEKAISYRLSVLQNPVQTHSKIHLYLDKSHKVEYSLYYPTGELLYQSDSYSLKSGQHLLPLGDIMNKFAASSYLLSIRLDNQIENLWLTKFTNQ